MSPRENITLRSAIRSRPRYLDPTVTFLQFPRINVGARMMPPISKYKIVESVATSESMIPRPCFQTLHTVYSLFC
jgi:hypothetical protein